VSAGWLAGSMQAGRLAGSIQAGRFLCGLASRLARYWQAGRLAGRFFTLLDAGWLAGSI
jgi:hypothetical protein